MADKVYSSIQIVCALKRVFPELVVQKIRYYAKLAIDLNGYTVEELKEFVKMGSTEVSEEQVKSMKMFCDTIGIKFNENRFNDFVKITTEISEYTMILKYTKKKYNRTFHNLKRYQVLNVIQKFNIYIPLLKDKLDIYFKWCNKFNKYYKRVNNELVLCDSQNNKETRVSILEPIRFMYNVLEYNRKKRIDLFKEEYIDAKYTIKILKCKDKKVELLIVIRTKQDAYIVLKSIEYIILFAIISKYILGYLIPDEIVDIREIIRKSNKFNESVYDFKRSKLDKSIIYVNDTEYTDLYKKDIVYVEILSLKERFKYLSGTFKSATFSQFSEYFGTLFNKDEEHLSENLSKIKFDSYEKIASVWEEKYRKRFV